MPDLNGKGQDPSLPPNHPINALSPLRKGLILVTLSYCGFLANFIIAILLVAFPPLAQDFNVSPGAIANTVGYALLGEAIGTVFWNPLSKTIGRRWTYLLGAFSVLPYCVWQATAKSYGSFSASRVMVGLTLAWTQTIPPASVADIFRPEVRGHKMSLFSIGIVLSPTIAPFFCGLIVRTGWRNLFWFCLALSGLCFAMFLFLVPETLWNDDVPEAITSPSEKPEIETAEVQAPAGGHVGPAWMPWHRPGEYFAMFMSPVLMLRYIAITVPSFFYGMMFGWYVGVTVVLPQVLSAPPYSFATIPLGCAFLALVPGSIIGMYFGGYFADKTVAVIEKRKGSRTPEDRWWALIPMLPVSLLSLTVFGASIEYKWHWIVMLVFGSVYFFALTAATGVIATYVMETYLERSMDTQSVFTFWRMLWGFAVPFFVMQWAAKIGFLASFAIQGALTAGLGGLLTFIFIWKGEAIRRWQGMPEFA